MQHKLTFLHQNRPLNTCMIQKRTALEVLNCIRGGAFDGCDAFGLQMCKLEEEYRTDKHLQAIFREMGPRPCYVTNYRGHLNGNKKTDEELEQELLHALSCGATLLDITGDHYAPDPNQVTHDSTAIDRQMTLIEDIHRRGGEVLMSSHVLRYAPAEEVLDIAREHQRRGADISKIVTAANSVEEEMENLRITSLLKKELDIPFLFLAGGSHNKLHRTVGPLIGCAMWLTVHEYDDLSTRSQPATSAITAIRDHFDY